MDNLTHSLVGAALARAGADRPGPLATATLVLAANVPDVDVLGYAGGEYFALAHRRGITHGLPAALLWPFVVVGVALAYDRLVRRRGRPQAQPARAGPLLAWSAVAVLTHPVLDWMNTYGMRWWLPFDGSWTYGDALFIIDPWIWLLLGGTIFLSVRPARWGTLGWGALALLTSALVLAAPVGGPAKAIWLLGVGLVAGSRLTARPATPEGRLRLARGGALVTVAYVALMVVADLPARAQVERAARMAGLDVVDVMVSPEPANPFRASVEVRTSRAFVPGTHRWLAAEHAELRPAEAVPVLDGPADVAPGRLRTIVEAARRDTDAAHWLVWARYPYARVDKAGAGWLVRFGDARYDDRGGTGGLAGLVVRLGSDLSVPAR